MASNIKVDIVKPTATNGSLSLKGDSGGSATANGITVDSSGNTSISGNVGIGTSSPSNAKTVIFTDGTDGANEVALALNHGDSTLGINQEVQLNFGQGNNANIALSQIAGSFVSSPFNGNLIFRVNNGVAGNLTEAMRIDSSGNLKFNSGYGSVATAYACRAWVNFNGTGTVAIRESGNVSSITDHATGQYEVNFATPMPDADYSAIFSVQPPAGTGIAYSTIFSSVVGSSFTPQNPTSSGYRILIYGSAAVDSAYILSAVFR